VDLEPAPEEWTGFLDATGAEVFVAALPTEAPVLAFLDERHELLRTFDVMRADGRVPAGFQRIIDRRFSEAPAGGNEVILNRSHRLVARALEGSTRVPIASVLRLLVLSALGAAGASLDRSAHRVQAEDLDWIGEALWGRDADGGSS